MQRDGGSSSQSAKTVGSAFTLAGLIAGLLLVTLVPDRLLGVLLSLAIGGGSAVLGVGLILQATGRLTTLQRLLLFFGWMTAVFIIATVVGAVM
jgi:hypothetical protein